MYSFNRIVELRLRRLSDESVIAVSGIINQVIESGALPSVAQRRLQPIDEGCKRRDIAGVELQCDRTAPYCLNLADDSLRLFAAALIGDDDVASASRDADRGVTTEPTAGTGNKGDLGHGQSLKLPGSRSVMEA